MNRKTRKMLMGLLSLVFVACAGLSLRQLYQYRTADQSQDLAQQLVSAPAVETPDPTAAPTPISISIPLGSLPAELPESPTVPAESPEPLDPEVEFLLTLDLAPLQDVNVDVIGWLHIPGGEISHPLLRSKDNQDYLTHAWDGRPSGAGSIFLECKNRMNFLDFNTVIYGHHMQNGSFFAPLLDYRSQKHRDAYPYVYLVTETDLRRYEIFSAYKADIESDTFRLYYPDEAARQAALEHFTSSTILDPVESPATSDFILTLSTCTGDGNPRNRWVVQAKLTGIWIR